MKVIMVSITSPPLPLQRDPAPGPQDHRERRADEPVPQVPHHRRQPHHGAHEGEGNNHTLTKKLIERLIS